MLTSFLNFFFNCAQRINFNFNNPSLLLDAPTPWQIGFQEPASPGFEGIIALHDSILFYLVLIIVSVFWLIFSVIRHFSSAKTGIIHKYLNHSTVLELIWTVSPAFILVAIAFPSFKLLYTLDEVIDPALTIKVTGFSKNGLKSYILNKIKDTCTLQRLKSFIQKNSYDINYYDDINYIYSTNNTYARSAFKII